MAWLQLRGTYSEQSWSYMQLLVSGFPKKDMRLLGDAYGQFVADCDRMYQEPKLSITEPLFPAATITRSKGALSTQRALVEAGQGAGARRRSGDQQD